MRILANRNASRTSSTGLRAISDICAGLNHWRIEVTIHTVTKSDTSKKGAPRIYLDNKHNWQDAVYISQRMPGPAPEVGMSIDAQMVSKDFNNDGKLTWFLNSWTEAK